MRDSIKLLENMMDNNRTQMHLLALEYIRGERADRNLKEEFSILENKNVALNEAVEILYEAFGE